MAFCTPTLRITVTTESHITFRKMFLCYEGRLCREWICNACRPSVHDHCHCRRRRRRHRPAPPIVSTRGQSSQTNNSRKFPSVHKLDRFQLTMGIPDLSQADIALIGFGGSTPTPVRVVDFITGLMVLAGVMILCVGIMSRLRRIPVVVTITADC